jgi:hypothetical protein
MYAIVCKRPNIAHAVGVLNMYMSKPSNEHWKTTKRIFRYLHGTTSYGLYYQGRIVLDRVLDIHGFVYGELDGDMDHRISTNRYVFSIFGGAINWMRESQFVVALSTKEDK